MGHTENDPSKTWSSLLAVPVFFLGRGILRAWTELMYVGPAVSYPGFPAGGTPLFDVLSILVAAATAVAVYRTPTLAPLFARRRTNAVVSGSLAASVLLAYALVFTGLPWTSVFLVAVALGAFGATLALLAWSELFACFSPLHVLAYYGAGSVLDGILSWLVGPLPPDRLFACLLIMVGLLAWCFERAKRSLSPDDVVANPASRYTFPWKPVAVVALFTFAMAIVLSFTRRDSGVNANPGILLGGLAVLGVLALKGEKLELSLLWKIALPVALAGILLLGIGNERLFFASSVLATVAYTLYATLVLVILSNMSYRYGVCALWLFALELAIRFTMGTLGNVVGEAIQTYAPPAENSLVLGGVALVACACIAGATLLCFSEKSTDSAWGVVLKRPASADIELGLLKTRLGARCHEVAAAHDLTQREEEILYLLAQGRRAADIAEALTVGVSTVRSHIKHIHSKLDVHSRKELLELVGVASDEG